MIPASVQVACYFYESELRLRWEYSVNCSDCGAPFDFLSYLVILLRPFMSLLVGMAAAAWICCDKTVKTWRRVCWCRSLDKNSTISTTSTGCSLSCSSVWAAGGLGLASRCRS